MRADIDGDCIIKDPSGSFVSFVRDTESIKIKLRRKEVKEQVSATVLVILACFAGAFIGQGDKYIVSVLLLVPVFGIPVAMMIMLPIIKNRIMLKKMCITFTIFKDRIDIDEKEFRLEKISSAWMTPFEYYEKRYICFKYEGKKYRYYFGKNNGSRMAEYFFKPYMEMSMLLESRGFSYKY